MKIGVVDLFCGIGGLTFGLQKAGLDVIAGIDIDSTCEYVIQFQTDTSKKLADKLTGANDLSHTAIQKIVHEQIVEESHKLGLKPIIDQQKKKILISHTRRDKDLADIIYNMLLYNGVPARDILYTNCDDEVARIPEDVEIYDYLRAFFVDSISTQKIYVIYVTSEDMGKSWGAISEVGAGWITAVNHKIFNAAHNYRAALSG